MNMPTIYTIGSIKILMYFDDHNPPHIHAEYNEYEELIEIESLATYRGYIPTKQRKLVVDWMNNNKEHLMNYWNEFNNINRR